MLLGHGSVENMFHALSINYQWYNMKKSIEKYVLSCKICIKNGNYIIQTKNKIIKTTRPD